MINLTVRTFTHEASTWNSCYSEERIHVCHCRKVPLHFVPNPSAQLGDGGAHAADLFQAAWRLFRPFVGRWNIKRAPAGYTSDDIKVQHITERQSAGQAVNA